MLLSQEELADSAKINPEVAEYLAKHPRPPADYSDPLFTRKVMQAIEAPMLAKLGPSPANVSETTHDIPMRDGFSSTLRIQRPSFGSPGPLIVLCFGGGFVGGSNKQFTGEARALVQLFGATVVSIAYRLAPEYKFPYSQYDAWDSCKLIAAHASDAVLNADPTKAFILGGVSAGAALTACLSREFQEEPLAHPLTGQWLAVPPIMDAASVPPKYKDCYLAPEQNANAAALSKEMREALKQIVGWDPTSELRHAVRSKTDVAAQPKTYFQVDGQDPLRDDGLIYDEILKEAGVQTKLDFYPGCPHAHWQVVPDLEVSKKCRVDTLVGFGWLLGKPMSRAEAAKVLGITESPAS